MFRKKRVYLDTASQTLPSKQVKQAMRKVEQDNYNPANIYLEGDRAKQILDKARTQIARTLGVKIHEVYFTHTGTSSIVATIFGLVEEYKEKNQEQTNYQIPHIITSTIEHSAVRENLKYLEKSGEIVLSYLPCDEEGIISVEELTNMLRPNTILITVMYVNNELGTIQDITKLSKILKTWKKDNAREERECPYLHTDACQAGNYLSLKVDKLGVDLLSLNSSKIYGPKSIAILMKKEYVNLLPSYFGGDQERGLFSGTVDVVLATGLACALVNSQINIQDFEKLQQLARNRNYLVKEILASIPEARINGYFNDLEWQVNKGKIKRKWRVARRVPSNLNIWLPNISSDELVLRLDQVGFAVSAGSACSARENEYSETIFAIYRGNVGEVEAKKRARESIRITMDKNIKKSDLFTFSIALKKIYSKFRQNR